MWWVMMTDMHLQESNKGKQYENFKNFLDNILPKINPNFVINSGDITNGIETIFSSIFILVI